MTDVTLQRDSRARIRGERDGDPHWTYLGDGRFALHIQSGGNAVVVDVGQGTEDQMAFREWLTFHWPEQQREVMERLGKWAESVHRALVDLRKRETRFGRTVYVSAAWYEAHKPIETVWGVPVKVDPDMRGDGFRVSAE